MNRVPYLALPTPTPRTRADGPRDPMFERVRAGPGGRRAFLRGDLHRLDVCQGEEVEQTTVE